METKITMQGELTGELQVLPRGWSAQMLGERWIDITAERPTAEDRFIALDCGFTYPVLAVVQPDEGNESLWAQTTDLYAINLSDEKLIVKRWCRLTVPPLPEPEPTPG
jgi:hypothetical protein